MAAPFRRALLSWYIKPGGSVVHLHIRSVSKAGF